MELEHVSQLISDLAASSDIVDTDGEIAEDVWGLECGEVDVAVTYHSEPQTVTLETVLGRPGDHNRVSTYATLLGITARSRELRGLRMSLESAGGDVIQECDVPVANLDGEYLRFFTEKARQGAELLRGTPSSAELPMRP